jgi:hypothetical protein
MILLLPIHLVPNYPKYTGILGCWGQNRRVRQSGQCDKTLCFCYRLIPSQILQS